MTQRVIVIINPVSGRTRGDHALMHLFRRLRTVGADLDVFRTTAPGDARRWGRQAAASRADLVIVAGGDGTVSEVVCGLREADGPAQDGQASALPPLLIAPRGTENVLAKYLGLRLDGNLLAEAALNGRAQEIDLGLCNGRPFMLVAGVGFDAEVVRRVHAVRRRHLDYGAYFWPLWRTFWSYRHPVICVDVDGRRVFAGPGLAIAGNIPRYAMGLRILRDARPDDGLMDVCIFAVRSRRGLIHHAVRAALARHVGRPDVVYRQGRVVRIDAANEPHGAAMDSAHRSQHASPAPCVEMDGDPCGELPIELEVIPRGARFIVPQGWRM
ncbi:MAG: diacylglycerol kinase family lipid kinase [Planctomycetia bacterium]|nr:MAG: diacylglycerol kinase family lipid kinase [Planctomycetia bacterium]